MNWIKNALLITAVSLFCYAVLIAGDWMTTKIMMGSLDASAHAAQEIEQDRAASEDHSYRDAAVSEGYVGILWPNFFDRNEALSTKMRELGIGSIGSTPNAKTYSCNEGYGLVKYTSDRFGLRNDDAKWDQPVDTLFIGDSYTYGACVQDADTLPNLYQGLTGKNALNLGFGSNNPQHYATLVKLFTPRLKPKNVIMIFYPNDMGTWNSTTFDLHVRNNAPFFDETSDRIAPLQSYYDLHNFARANSNETFHGSEELRLSYTERFFYALNQRWSLPAIRELIQMRMSSNDNLLGDSAMAIETAQTLCAAPECHLKVVYIPNSKFWRPDARAERYRTELRDFTAKIGVPFLDGATFLNQDENSPDFAVKGPHLSPDGYAKVARMLADKLSASN